MVVIHIPPIPSLDAITSAYILKAFLEKEKIEVALIQRDSKGVFDWQDNANTNAVRTNGVLTLHSKKENDLGVASMLVGGLVNSCEDGYELRLTPIHHVDLLLYRFKYDRVKEICASMPAFVHIHYIVTQYPVAGHLADKQLNDEFIGYIAGRHRTIRNWNLLKVMTQAGIERASVEGEVTLRALQFRTRSLAQILR